MAHMSLLYLSRPSPIPLSVMLRRSPSILLCDISAHHLMGNSQGTLAGPQYLPDSKVEEWTSSKTPLERNQPVKTRVTSKRYILASDSTYYHSREAQSATPASRVHTRCQSERPVRSHCRAHCPTQNASTSRNRKSASGSVTSVVNTTSSFWSQEPMRVSLLSRSPSKSSRYPWNPSPNSRRLSWPLMSV